MAEENTPTADAPSDDASDDSRYNYVRTKLDAHEKALASHGGVLEELKSMLGGFLETSAKQSSATPPATPPAAPEADAPPRAAPKKKKQWF